MNTPDDVLDPTLAPYAQRLEKIYNDREIPATLNWQDIRVRHTEATLSGRRVTALRRVRVRSMSRVSPRVALIMAALAIVLMAGGVAATLFSPLLTHDLQSFGGTNSVLMNREFVKLNQSKIIDGFTMKLETGYIDANRAVLGYSITMPTQFQHDGHWWAFGLDSLQTASGLALPDTSSAGTRAGTNVISYDAGVIQGNPATLKLHAEVAFGCDTNTDAQGHEDYCSQEGTRISNDLHWTFDFTLPFHHGQVINVHQSATDHGLTATLDRVVLTDSETRVYLSGLPYGQPAAGQAQSSYFATLTLNGQNYDMYIENQQNSPDGLFIIFDSVLVGQHGSGTLDVQQQVMMFSPKGGPPQMGQGGHWVMHFQIP